jgi:hypothetical protein
VLYAALCGIGSCSVVVDCKLRTRAAGCLTKRFPDEQSSLRLASKPAVGTSEGESVRLSACQEADIGRAVGDGRKTVSGCGESCGSFGS